MSAHFVSLTDVSAESTHWLWPGRIPLGAITILEGMPGCGKSFLVAELAARLTTGRPLPDCEAVVPPSAAILLQAEDSPETTRARVQSAGGDLSCVLIVEGAVGGEALRLPDGIGEIAACAQKHRAKLIVIDPVTAWFDRNLSGDRSAREMLKPLANLAQCENAAVLLVRHLTKSVASSPIYRGAGAISLIGAARSALLCTEDPLNGASKLLVQVKSNIGSIAPPIRFGIVEQNGQARIEWRGQSTATAETLGTDSGMDHAPVLREAVQTLFAILGDGPVRVGEVEKLARLAGISMRTLRRAKHLLGVTSRREGFGRGSVFYWHMSRENDLVNRLWEGEIDAISERLFHGEDSESARMSRSDDLQSDPSVKGQKRTKKRGTEEDPGTSSVT